MSLSACGGGSSDSASGSTTLTTPLSFNPGSLDPDVFYGNEGLLITTSCYDGLLQYEPNTTNVEGALAEDWQVSNGGKRYTFELRKGVKFADGTPFDAEAAQFSIERRGAVNAGPAYMVEPIAKMTAPDPYTLVLDLKTPINPFEDWLASPYGLKMVSPKAIEQNSSGDDPQAEKWLADHCAGTGPYDLTEAQPGQEYKLEANENYWGEEPDFTTVELPVIPSFSTQALQLRGGDIDMMTHGLTKEDVLSFESDSEFEVAKLPAISAINLWVNANKPNLQDPKVREAIGLALDREGLVEQVYGDEAEVYNQIFAPDTLEGHDYSTPYDPEQAKEILSGVPEDERTIQLQFTSDDATNQQIAGLIAQQLNEVGFDVDQRGLPETEVFNFTEAPDDRKPDMIVLPQNPDDSSPASFPLLQWIDDGAFFPPIDPAADKLLFQAIETEDDDEAIELYGQAADRYLEADAFVPIANTKAIIVARSGIGNIQVERQGLWTVDLGALTNDGS
ncbi:ABC transporter substrate-binding protein [Thermoleophilia bacterium SCSIO 60948]|nr:ABC transporter substrate-binding protein [Thermoleophilia bacterium SCSIO 60948]